VNLEARLHIFYTSVIVAAFDVNKNLMTVLEQDLTVSL
jgi:hypothetical protein